MQHKAYDCVSCLNRRHMLWAWCSLFWVGFTDLYVRLCSMGIWTIDCEDRRYLERLHAGTSSHDDSRTNTTSWSSAPAAPGCGPPSRPPRPGVSVGLVCKSLLGKAHTVMAEGGIAAALANVDDRDNWKVHFADTMRGGQYVNNWRMAQLHAQEAPDRVRELEAWGAVFDRTPDGRILQRNFGGHRYPRLAHVGDRTGLEMIRTLQDHGIHQGIDVYMECTVVRLLKDGDRIAGALRLRPRTRPLRRLPGQGGRAGDRRHRQGVQDHQQLAGSTPATATPWPTTPGPNCIDMEFVQFHPTGMVWPPSVRGILVTEGVRGEGGVLRNNKGERFMFDDIPENYKPPDGRRTPKKAGATARATRTPTARRNC